MRLAATFLLALSAFAQPEGTGAIAGVVVDSATGDPMRKVVVMLTWHGSPRCIAAVMTNAAGRFLFESLPPGKYTARARNNIPTEFSQSPVPATDFVTLGPGEHKDGIRIALPRLGSISGSVLDADGDPAVGMPVSLMTEAGIPGRGRQLVGVSNSQTNERGEYRFQKLARGRYWVQTGGDPRRMFRSGEQREYVVRQFYGGATDWKRAAPILLKPGEQLAGIDFRVVMAQGIALRGTLVGIPAQAPTTGMPVPTQRQSTVELAQVSEPGDPSGWGVMTAYALPDRRFQFQPVPPGPYRLSASVEYEKVVYVAAQEIELSPEQREVALSMSPAGDVKGQIRTESGVPVDGMKVILSRNYSADGPSPAKVAKDGSFVFFQVPPGRYFLRMDGMPKGAYERSLRVGGKEVPNFQPVEIGTEDPGQIEIAVGAKIPSVEGVVEDEAVKRHPVAVLLAPADPRVGINQVPSIATTGKDGDWKIETPPGKYKLIAYEPTIESSQLWPADLASRLDRFATAIDVPEGGGIIDAKPALVHAEQVDEALR